MLLQRVRKYILFLGVLLGLMIFGTGVWGQQKLTTKEEARAIIRSDYFDEMDSSSQMKYQIIAGEKRAGGVIRPFDFEAARRLRRRTVSFFPFVSGRPLTGPFTNVLLNDPSLDLTALNTQSETAIVLGAGGDIVSGFNDSGSFAIDNSKFIGYSTSSNSGAAWTDRGELLDSVSGEAGDPVLARNNSTGTILFATVSFHIANQINIFRSTDDGVTFDAPINGTPDTPNGMHDKPWLAVDNFPGPGNGNAYLFWRDFGTGGGMRFSRSTDDGVTWALAGGGVLSTASTNQGAQVAVGPDHTVYLMWLAANQMVIRRSTDLGVSFGPPIVAHTLLSSGGFNGDLYLDGGFRTNRFPQLVVNPVSGYLYLVYADNPDGDDKADIFFRQSTNNGDIWSVPIRVNHDPGTNDQWQPAIGVSPDGTALFIGYYDRRGSPTNDRFEYWGRTAAIAGSGVTFGCEFPVTSTDSSVVVGVDPTLNAMYMGDYDMVAADNTNFYSNSADNRSGNADSRITVIPKAGPSGGSPESLTLLNQNVTLVTANSCVPITISVQNTGCDATAGPVTGTLSTTTPGVTIQNATQSFGTINGASSASNDAPFQLSVAGSFACGTTIEANLAMSSGEIIPVSFTSYSTGRYSITSSTGTISDGGNFVDGTNRDGRIVLITTPFAFSLYNHPIAAGQAIELGTSSGTIQILATGGNPNGGNTGLPYPFFGATTTVLMPYWDELKVHFAVTVGGGIFTETTGVAPNRTFKIEWRARHYYEVPQALGPPDTDFAVFFHEGSNSFEYVYALTGAGPYEFGNGATVGVQPANTGPDFTQFSYNSPSLTNGLKLNFVQPPVCPLGAGACTEQDTGTISGTVTYGNAIGNPAAPRFVKNVSVASTAGSPAVGPAITGTSGAYALTGFGAGPYTITPSKTGGLNNAITSFDAAKVAQHVAGANPLTGNALVVADVTGNGQIQSFDAARIAQYVAGTPQSSQAGIWKFFTVANVPFPPGTTTTNRMYAAVTANIAGEDYTGLLMGEVSGNWTNTGARSAESRQNAEGSEPKEKVGRRRLAFDGLEKSIYVDLGKLATHARNEIVVPLTVRNVADKGVISYEFDLRYDPSVIQPAADPDVKGTVSRGLSVVTTAIEPGLLRVVVYGATPIDTDGILLNLRFTAVGQPGTVSSLSFERIMFNEGEPTVSMSNGNVELY